MPCKNEDVPSSSLGREAPVATKSDAIGSKVAILICIATFAPMYALIPKRYCQISVFISGFLSVESRVYQSLQISGLICHIYIIRKNLYRWHAINPSAAGDVEIAFYLFY